MRRSPVDRWRPGTVALCVAVMCAFPPEVGAQARPSPRRAPAGPGWTAVAVSLAAVAVSLPLDGAVRTWMQDAPRQQSTVLRRATDVATPWGSWAPLAVGAGLFGAAEVFHRPALADAVWHTAEGTAAAGILGLVLKVAVHRTRPYASPHDPSTFFHGPLLPTESRRQSFPSGHTTVAFAVAAAASEEAAVHWPGHSRLLDGALYGMATAVAFSRVYDDVHWTSDVVAGAAVGTLVSRTVVSWAHRSGGRRGPRAGARLFVAPGRVSVVGIRLAYPSAR